MQSLEGHELLDQAAAGKRLLEMVLSLSSPTCAYKSCVAHLADRLSVYADDVDQAFESYRAGNVTASWQRLAAEFQNTFGVSVIQVRRGYRFKFRRGGSALEQRLVASHP